MRASCAFLSLIIVILASSYSSAFLPALTRYINHDHRSTSSLSVLYDPRAADTEFVEFPTSSQRVTLKKEANKRQARNELAAFSLPSEETEGPFSDKTLQALWSVVSDNELVVVRGISSQEKKWVYGIAERLCADLETIQSDLPVTLLSTKGHAAVIFCPSLPFEHPLHVPLRTSVGQKNKWRPRTKRPRDNRGQIIKD